MLVLNAVRNKLIHRVCAVTMEIRADDFGIQPFDAQSRAALMEIIEDRHGKTSLIITSQLPVTNGMK